MPGHRRLAAVIGTHRGVGANVRARTGVGASARLYRPGLRYPSGASSCRQRNLFARCRGSRTRRASICWRDHSVGWTGGRASARRVRARVLRLLRVCRLPAGVVIVRHCGGSVGWRVGSCRGLVVGQGLVELLLGGVARRRPLRAEAWPSAEKINVGIHAAVGMAVDGGTATACRGPACVRLRCPGPSTLAGSPHRRWCGRVSRQRHCSA